MTELLEEAAEAWTDAGLAAAVFATSPAMIGGVALRATVGPARDAWLAQVRALLPADVPVRRIPVHVGDDRLLGGLDLAATLAAGKPVMQRGLLAESDGGVAVLAMAERARPNTVAHVAAALDTGELVLERDGFAARQPARFGVVALDEGLAGDESPAAALTDRLAVWLNLEAMRASETGPALHDRDRITAARLRLPSVAADDEVLEALCAAAMSLGIRSLRAPVLALRVARAIAALAGRDAVASADAARAARLVLAPRALVLPVPDETDAPEDDAPRPEPDSEADRDRSEASEGALQDIVLAAAQAAIPPHLLALLALAKGGRALRAAGRSGVPRKSQRHGRPAGVRRGDPRNGARLNVVETLRAAAPWQMLRRPPDTAATTGTASRARIAVRRDDFRVNRAKQRSQTVTIFVVDASGSAALHRLAEAKGAVELVLAEAYVRRDQVALIAFRGPAAELILPPTRSLARAKRCLAGLPGGGATPLASGIDAGLALADGVRRKGHTPVLILLTDGRPNMGRDGQAARQRAEDDALNAAGAVRRAAVTALLVDTAPRPHPFARRIAEVMGAQYLPLPYANAPALSQAVTGVASCHE